MKNKFIRILWSDIKVFPHNSNVNRKFDEDLHFKIRFLLRHLYNKVMWNEFVDLINYL